MWLSERESRRNGGKHSAAIANVTIPGQKPAAWSGSELRGLTVLAPGGYVWIPGQSDEVLTLPCGTVEHVIAGAREMQAPAGMQPGEIYLHAASGASIRLKNDGTMELSGKLTVKGSLNVAGALTVNGMNVALSMN